MKKTILAIAVLLLFQTMASSQEPVKPAQAGFDPLRAAIPRRIMPVPDSREAKEKNRSAATSC